MKTTIGGIPVKLVGPQEAYDFQTRCLEAPMLKPGKHRLSTKRVGSIGNPHYKEGPSSASGQAPSSASGQAPSSASGQAPSSASGQAPSTSGGQALFAGRGYFLETTNGVLWRLPRELDAWAYDLIAMALVFGNPLPCVIEIEINPDNSFTADLL
jgi:hypothetical protein